MFFIFYFFQKALPSDGNAPVARANYASSHNGEYTMNEILPEKRGLESSPPHCGQKRKSFCIIFRQYSTSAPNTQTPRTGRQKCFLSRKHFVSTEKTLCFNGENTLFPTEETLCFIRRKQIVSSVETLCFIRRNILKQYRTTAGINIRRRKQHGMSPPHERNAHKKIPSPAERGLGA